MVCKEKLNLERTSSPSHRGFSPIKSLPLLLKDANATRRILIFRIGELGDSLIALPAISAVRRQFPRAHIAMLSNLNTQARHVTPDEILPKGLIDEWLTYPSPESGTNLFDKLALLRTLRTSRYDAVVYLAPRVRSTSAARRDLLFFRLSGIRRALAVDGFESLLKNRRNTPLPLVTHEADHLLGRLRRSGIEVPGSAQFDLALTESEISTASEWIQANVDSPPLFSLVGVGPGSKWPSKVWPEENYARVGQRLFCDGHQAYPIIFGGPADQALGDRLLKAWGRGANAAGTLSPRQAAAALAFCTLYVGNDTGTMHVAAAVGTRCVSIMSAQDWPGRWSPYGKGHTVLRKHVPCEGCQLKVCEREGLRCLTEISVEEVLNACLQILPRRSHSPVS